MCVMMRLATADIHESNNESSSDLRSSIFAFSPLEKRDIRATGTTREIAKVRRSRPSTVQDNI